MVLYAMIFINHIKNTGCTVVLGTRHGEDATNISHCSYMSHKMNNKLH